MAQVEDDGFARVVIAEGYCTREQVDRCVRIQSSTDERLSLGQSLLREGFLSREQYSRVLVLLRQGYKKDKDTVDRRASARQGQEDRVLGGIVVADGWISADQLKACLKESAATGRSLAETLVSRGLAGSSRVDEILRRLEKTEVTCSSCKATLSILRLPTSESLRCPRCQNPL